MASNDAGSSLPHNFFLTPQQQSLLFAALNSNKPTSSLGRPNQAPSLPPNSVSTSPVENGENGGFQESPYMESYDYEFGNSSFDYSFAGNDQAEDPSMIGDMPDDSKSESPDPDSSDKRSHPDEDDDDDILEKDPKRRESADKIPKKPGRKPLTSEPSSKRKAQNRAAQRAFRERKEKHLKDLETKVDELEKASEAANHENSKLRAQVERMNSELLQYKQKLTVMGDNKKPAGGEKPGFGKPALNDLSDVNFQFEFPRFGSLPTPPASKSQKSPSQSISPQQRMNSGSAVNKRKSSANSPQNAQQSSQAAMFNDGLAKFSSMFTPSMNTSTTSDSRASLDSANLSNFGANTSSPSSTSNSNGGPSSSCGTSPEPFTQSPLGFKPVETMTTIGEEQPSMSASAQPFAHFSNVDVGNLNFDWIAQQNGGQFDPQLFGEYREPQDNVLANPTFDDLFNESIDADFFTPYNVAPSPNGIKMNLIDQIDAKQESLDEDMGKVDNMNCHQIWEKLQECPKAQNGEIDIDGLCSELTAKAKCSGTGPVVNEMDFDTILKKYMGKDVQTECVATKLGISVDRTPKTNGAIQA